MSKHMKCPKCTNAALFQVVGWSLLYEKWNISVSAQGDSYDIDDIDFIEATDFNVIPQTECRCLQCEYEAEIEEFNPGFKMRGSPEVKYE